MRYRRRSFLSSCYRYLISITFILAAVYSLSGFIIIPWLARPKIAETITRLTGRECQIDVLKLNPFTLSATVKGFQLTDRDGEPLVSLSRFHANIQIWSFLLREEIHVKELSLQDPFFRTVVEKTGKVNFADILEKLGDVKGSSEEKEEPSSSRQISVDRLVVANGSVSISDLSRSSPFKSLVSPINLEINGFHTSGESDAPYGFTATTESGETVEWKGYVALEPLRSEGSFEISDIPISKYDPFSDIFLKTDFTDGTIGVSGRYSYLSGDDPKALLQDTEITVKNLVAVKESEGSHILSMDSGIISGISLDGISRNLNVQSVNVNNSRLNLIRTGESQLDIFELVKFDPPEKPATLETGSEADTNSNDFIFSVQNIKMGNVSLELLDQSLSIPASIAFDNITLDLDDLTNKPESEVGIFVSTKIRSGGLVNIAGTFSLQPIQAAMDLNVSDLALSAGNSYLNEFADIKISEGELNLTSHVIVDLSDVESKGEFTGDIGIIGLDAIEPDNGSSLVSLSLFDLNDIQASLNPTAIDINSISIIDPRAEVLINEDRTSNLAQAFRLKETEPGESTTSDGKPTTELLTHDQDQLSDSILPFPIAIGSITLENLGAVLTDESVSPKVRLGLQSLSGSIEELSSENLTRADLQFTGELVGGTRMSAKGQINPLISDKYSDMEVSLEGFNLVSVSPYSGKYVGYKLDTGSLSFNLNYKISQSELSGQNIMHIDHLVLGEKVESEDALNLPLPLAIALLKDGDGMIEIDVPVTGDLNDPEFGFGRVIARAIVNVITKIITSPFSMLGNLAGGGEDVDLSRVAFSPGSSLLEQKAINTLELLGKALSERPNLKLDISGAAGSPEEIDSLKVIKLDSLLKEMRWQELNPAGEESMNLSALQLAGDDRDRLIRESYYIIYPEEAVYKDPDPVQEEVTVVETDVSEVSMTAAEEKKKGLLQVILATFSGGSGQEPDEESPPEASVSVEPVTPLVEPIVTKEPEPEILLTVEEMEQRIFDTIQISQESLTDLADERANVIRTYLVDTAMIDPDRLSVSSPEDASAIDPQEGIPQATFKLE